MRILPFNMILQHSKDVQRMNVFAENSNLCFYYQTKCIVLSFSQYVVMNAFLLIAGQKAHICGVNHIFVLQETSRNELLQVGMIRSLYAKGYFCSFCWEMSRRISLAVLHSSPVVLLHE